MTASSIPSTLPYWPRLSRFYGLSIHELRTTPRVVLNAFIEQMPRLQAEEHLASLSISDWPHLAAKDRREVHRDLLRAADIPEPKAPVTQDPRTLGAIGIKVVREGDGA